MGTITVPPNAKLARIMRKAGANPDLANYDTDAGTLTCPDVTTPQLNQARQAVEVNKDDAVDAADRQAKRQMLREQAWRAHKDAILAADTVLQTKLADANRATTLGELEAITYP